MQRQNYAHMSEHCEQGQIESHTRHKGENTHEYSGTQTQLKPIRTIARLVYARIECSKGGGGLFQFTLVLVPLKCLFGLEQHDLQLDIMRLLLLQNDFELLNFDLVLENAGIHLSGKKLDEFQANVLIVNAGKRLLHIDQVFSCHLHRSLLGLLVRLGCYM